MYRYHDIDYIRLRNSINIHVTNKGYYSLNISELSKGAGSPDPSDFHLLTTLWQYTHSSNRHQLYIMVTASSPDFAHMLPAPAAPTATVPPIVTTPVPSAESMRNAEAVPALGIRSIR